MQTSIIFLMEHSHTDPKQHAYEYMLTFYFWANLILDYAFTKNQCHCFSPPKTRALTTLLI